MSGRSIGIQATKLEDVIVTLKKGLPGKTPLEFAGTGPGALEAEAVLDRIEDGVFY